MKARLAGGASALKHVLYEHTFTYRTYHTHRAEEVEAALTGFRASTREATGGLT